MTVFACLKEAVALDTFAATEKGGSTWKWSRRDTGGTMKRFIAAFVGVVLVMPPLARADTRDDLLVAIATIEASLDHGVSPARFAEYALRLDVAHRVLVAKKASHGAADKAVRDLVAASGAVASAWGTLRERLCTYGVGEGKASFASGGWCRTEFTRVYGILKVEMPPTIDKNSAPDASDVIKPLLTRLSQLSKAAMEALSTE